MPLDRLLRRRCALPLAALASTCLLLLVPPGVQAAPKDAPATAPVRALLEQGKAAEALAAAYLALERDADDVDLLQVASEAAEQASKPDEALWLAQLALRTALTGGSPGPLQRELAARTRALDPLPEAVRPPLEGYARRLFDLGQLCVKRKLYANAVDFFERCADTPLTEDATAQLDKLYGNRRAVDAMLASGLDVPLRSGVRKSARRIAKEDAQHATWKKAWRIKGDNYTVETNAGWELGSAVLDAMEQVNRYYREVFQHKLRGGGTARCTIRLYGTRKEFEALEGETDATVSGFYSNENYVACYDPRTAGERLGDLWETLFHEASHQFTHMISTGTIPGWLNEGTATYFEGTRRQANGRIEANLVHEGRLDHLKEVLQKGSPSIRDVVSYFGDESYDLDYYPVGGYLVYFFKNYEDEQCERVYAPHFDAYVRSYRSGGKHDPFERFVEYFVKRPAQPGVTTFEEFAERFKTWCLQLHDLQFGPPERADVLIERGDRQRKAGKLDAALDSYRWALAKRVNDPRALLGLAEVHATRKEEDAAVYRYRQLVDLARRAEDPAAPLDGLPLLTAKAVLERATAAIAGVDRTLAGAIQAADTEFVAQVRTAAGKYAEAGYPRVAVWTLDTACTAVAGNRDLEEAQHALEAKHAVQARLWRRLPLDLEAWVGAGAWRVDGDALVGKGDGQKAHEFLLREPMPERYRLQVTLTVRGTTGPDPFAGVLYGVDDGGVWDLLASSSDGAVDVSRSLTDWKVTKTLPSLAGTTSKPFTLGVEVERGQVRFFVEGKHAYTHPYPPAELRGRVGLMVQDLEVAFTDIRVAY